ncbi:MAG: ABC transporter ATP-binding protein [Firmicutes bacterium]|nr:ABC transporter ATP-binding protein [Bacillota bacterium]
MKSIKRYFEMLKPMKRSLIIALLVAIFCNIISVIPTLIVGRVSDSIKLGNLTNSLLFKSFAIMIINLILSYIGLLYYNYIIFRNFYFVEKSIRIKLIKKVLAQSPPFFLKHNASSIMTRGTVDASLVADVTAYGFFTVIDGVTLLFAYIITMFSFHPLLAFTAILSVPITVFTALKITKNYDKKVEELQKSMEDVNEMALESFSAIKLVKAFVIEKLHMKKFIEKVELNLKKQLERTEIGVLFGPAITLILGIFTAISFYLGSYLITKGELTIGELISHSMILANLGWPAIAISDCIIVLKDGSVGLNRIDEILNYEDDIKKPEYAFNIDRINSIEFKNFNFKYPGSNEYQLKNINLKITKGKKLGIVGKTGSSKTTLLRQIIREYGEFEGELLINKSSIMDIDIDDYRSLVGYVPQEHFLFSKTIRENILFYREGDVYEAAKNADFLKDLDNLQNGLDTMSGEMGVTLSGGQKQRVALSRAMLTHPELLVLDDVLSAVDNKTENEILNNIANNFNNSTIIMSSHKISAIKDADEIIVLDNGEIVERGSYEELVQNGKWFSEQAALQEVSYGE